MNLLFRLLLVLAALSVSLGRANAAITLPENIRNYLRDRSLTENGTLPELMSDGKAFIEYIVDNRTAIMDNFLQVASDARRQHLVLTALEFAPPAEYLTVLDRVLQLRETNAVTSETVEIAFKPRMVKFGFISHNHQHQQVQPLIQRALAVTEDRPTLNSYFLKVHDGTQRGSDAQYIAMNELQPPEVLSPP